MRRVPPLGAMIGLGDPETQALDHDVRGTFTSDDLTSASSTEAAGS